MRWVYEIEPSLKSPHTIVVGYLHAAMALATESACEARIADASASFLINCLSPVFTFLAFGSLIISSYIPLSSLVSLLDSRWLLINVRVSLFTFNTYFMEPL